MSNVWFIADTHFNHRRLIQTEDGRAFDSIREHDELIVERWNEVVHPKRDVVWHLGDLGMWYPRDFGEAAMRLNGRKKLILGNHDNLPHSDYEDLGFEVVPQGRGEYGFWLSHIPIHPMSVNRWLLNIHGHTHAHKVRDNRYLCVSCEQVDYRPVCLDEIREERGF